MLVYLEQSQETDTLSLDFRSSLVDDFPRAADFFSLGSALFLQAPSTGDSLKLTAWTNLEAVPKWSLELDPPLRLRLTAGIPQVLTGPEKLELKSFCSRHFSSAPMAIALPLVAEPRTLLGAIVLVDSPPFDLEDEDFVLAWTQYKYTLIQSLSPRQKFAHTYSEAGLMRTLEAGHAFLAAEIDTSVLDRHCDEQGLSHRRARLQVERALSELTGNHGAILWRAPLLTALFVLPGRMDRDLLWHQIEVSLRWPEGFTPEWTTRVLRTPHELQLVLGR